MGCDFNSVKRKALMFQYKDKRIARIEEEAELFEKRGWCDYISFLYDLIPFLEKEHFILWKSARNSHLLNHALYYSNGDMTNDDKQRQILFNDALRLDAFTPTCFECSVAAFKAKIMDQILCYLNEYGLFYKEVVFDNEKAESNTLLIISNSNNIPDEDVDVILNETKESSDSEAEVLRKYFLLTIRIAKESLGIGYTTSFKTY